MSTEVINIWIYYFTLHQNKHKAGSLAKRFEEDWYLYENIQPTSVEVFKTKVGNFGIKYKVGVE